MKVGDFKDLIVWQRAKELVLLTYKITSKFPKEEQFGLVSQMRRAAVSILSNITEGYARRHTGEFLQFLYISLGSAAEYESQLIVSNELDFLIKSDYDLSNSKLKEVQRMLNSLINSLRKK